MNSKKIRTIGAVILAVLVLLSVGYQVFQATHHAFQTETAMYGQVSDVLQTEGFVIREETVIDETVSGVLSYRVADGTRVAKGGVIADVFSTESDASAQREKERLEKRSKAWRPWPSRQITLWPILPCSAGKSIPPLKRSPKGSTRMIFPTWPLGRRTSSAP